MILMVWDIPDLVTHETSQVRSLAATITVAFSRRISRIESDLERDLESDDLLVLDGQKRALIEALEVVDRLMHRVLNASP